MTDVFVSYARSDEPQATHVADALRSAGYHVWRDDELPAHRAYADVIEERLKSAKAVVVLWSAEAAKSEWVRAEADAARSTRSLVQASLDGTVPPMPFNQIQCADLSNWDGIGETAGWRKLCASVAELAGAQGMASEKKRLTAHEVSVCVLPFANMSGDAEQEYFSDGISEDITTDLSRISALEVIARNTAFQFKGQSIDVCDVAQKLGVTHVLEGSVRKAGNRVRVTAQLIDGRTGGHLWADRYDRNLDDIFEIQDEISHSIVDALKIRLLPEEKAAIENRGTDSGDAYDLYLLARNYWVSGNWGDPRREEAAIRMCDRILEIEPSYGRAWALKALAQAYLFFGFNRGEENGLHAAETALALDPSLPEPYCAKARALAAQRRFEEGERQVEIALALAPDSWEVRNEAGATYFWQRKYREAVEHFEKCVELEQADQHSCIMLCMAFRGLGDESGVRRAAERLLRACDLAIASNPKSSSALGNGATALATLGHLERARERMRRAILIDPDNLNIRYNFARALINHSDDLDLAFEHLDFVLARSIGSIVRRADLDPDLDRIRKDPRFQRIYAAARERIAVLDAEKVAYTPPAAPTMT